MHIMGYMILFCICVLCCSLCEGVKNTTENKKFPACYFLGDSVFDTGNNNQLTTFFKANFPPYGKDFKGGIPTGRFCNGKIIPDFIVEKLGIKEYVPPYVFNPYLNSYDLKTGVSVGSAGAGYDPLTSKTDNAISLTKQLDLFKEYIKKLKEIAGEKEANDIIAKSLYLIEAGVNDVANYFNGGPRQIQYSIYAYAELLANYASFYIKEMYKLGARKIAVINVPPVGCAPIERTLFGGPTRMCAEKVNEGAKIINEKLYSEIKSLAEKLPQAKVCYIDLYNPALDIIKKPESYGFEVVKIGCCGTGTIEFGPLCNKLSGTCPNVDEYFFWDAVHPTERGYKILAEYVYDQLKKCFPDESL